LQYKHEIREAFHFFPTHQKQSPYYPQRVSKYPRHLTKSFARHDKNMSKLRADLEELRDFSYLATHRKIGDILASELNSLTDENADQLVTETANAIRRLDPKVEEFENAAALQDDFWTVLIDVSARVPSRHEGQQFLVKLLMDLNTHAEAGGEIRICLKPYNVYVQWRELRHEQEQPISWNDLPLLAQVMRDKWNGQLHHVLPGNDSRMLTQLQTPVSKKTKRSARTRWRSGSTSTPSPLVCTAAGWARRAILASGS
jgi:hypothetical protein